MRACFSRTHAHEDTYIIDSKSATKKILFAPIYSIKKCDKSDRILIRFSDFKNINRDKTNVLIRK